MGRIFGETRMQQCIFKMKLTFLAMVALLGLGIGTDSSSLLAKGGGEWTKVGDSGESYLDEDMGNWTNADGRHTAEKRGTIYLSVTVIDLNVFYCFTCCAFPCISHILLL